MRKCQNLQWMPSKAYLQKQAKGRPKGWARARRRTDTVISYVLTSQCLFPCFKKPASRLKSRWFIHVALLMLLLPSCKKEREEIEDKREERKPFWKEPVGLRAETNSSGRHSERRRCYEEEQRACPQARGGEARGQEPLRPGAGAQTGPCGRHQEDGQAGVPASTAAAAAELRASEKRST